ncbi:MAG: DUF421 domain-containing protein [Clostridia bacterium]|nr:DUF421 domain-containing protein [Clostridia bacterium]
MDVGTALETALEMAWKAALFYGVLLALLRLMGKREVSSFTPLDLVVSIMLADAAIISIEEDRIPVAVGLVPVAVLAGLQILFAELTLRSRRARLWIEGRPAIVVRDGRVDERELRRQRMNLDELLSNLRLHKVPRVEDVACAVLEPSGRLSVVPKSSAAPPSARDLGLEPPDASLPFALVVDGAVDRDGLRALGADLAWLSQALGQAGVTDRREVLLALFDPSGRLFVQRRARGPRPEPGRTVRAIPPGGRRSGRHGAR